jgi:hypothetical protein
MDLATRYLGLELRNPIVASAGRCRAWWTAYGGWRPPESAPWCPPRYSREQIRRGEERGAMLAELGTDCLAAALEYPPPGGQRHGPSGYLRLIEQCAGSAGVPVIASLQRLHHRRLDRLRRGHAAGRGRRALPYCAHGDRHGDPPPFSSGGAPEA